jgi:hypothetical protein
VYEVVDSQLLLSVVHKNTLVVVTQPLLPLVHFLLTEAKVNRVIIIFVDVVKSNLMLLKLIEVVPCLHII